MSLRAELSTEKVPAADLVKGDLIEMWVWNRFVGRQTREWARIQEIDKSQSGKTVQFRGRLNDAVSIRECRVNTLVKVRR